MQTNPVPGTGAAKKKFTIVTLAALGLIVVAVGGNVMLATQSLGDLSDCGVRSYAQDEIATVRSLLRPVEPDSVTSAEVTIDAPPSAIWDIVEHFETAWPASNSEHIQTCVVDSPKTVHEDMIYHDIESVGGITAKMYAHVYDVIPERQFRWKAVAIYDLGLFALPIRQGGTFRIEPEGDRATIIHEVWADFPDTTGGRIAEWVGRNLLAMEVSSIEHNRKELEYFRSEAETESENGPLG